MKEEYPMKKNNLIIIFIILLTITFTVSAETKGKIEDKTYKMNQTENIVFLGDSIFEYYQTNRIFDDLPIVNSGVAGNTTQDVLNDLEKRVYQYNPTKIFINIGTNDIPGEDSDEINNKVVNNIKEIIGKIKKNRKKCDIYLISIYPVNHSLSSALERHSDEIKSINDKLQKYCNISKDATYIDAYSHLCDENDELSLDYTKDGLHLSDLGYAKLTEILMKYIYQ